VAVLHKVVDERLQGFQVRAASQVFPAKGVLDGDDDISGKGMSTCEMLREKTVYSMGIPR